MHILSISFFNKTNISSFRGNDKNIIPVATNCDAVAMEYPCEININRLKELGIKNLRLVNSNSISGATLSGAKDALFSELKECGIETIVDLRREADPNSNYAIKANNGGLDYFAFPTNDSMPPFCRPLNTKLTMDNFRTSVHEYCLRMQKFFEVMSHKHLYIGCFLGLHRTDLAVSLNYLLNPIEPSEPPSLSHMFFKNETNFTNLRIAAIKNLFNNLSLQDRIMLGLNPDYIDIFRNRVAKLRMMNLK